MKFKGPLYIGTPSVLIFSIMAIIFLIISEIKKEYFDSKLAFFHHQNAWVRHLSYAGIILFILLFGVFDGGQFIYFQC